MGDERLILREGAEENQGRMKIARVMKDESQIKKSLMTLKTDL